MKKEIASVKNWKEAFCETALCSVNSSQRVKSFPSSSLSISMFLWNFKSDIWKLIEGYIEKGNEKKLSEKLLCVLSFTSQRYSFPR